MSLEIEERLQLPSTLEEKELRQPLARRPTRQRPRHFTAVLGIGLVTAIALVALLADVIAPTSPWTSVARPFQPPSGAYPFGTDDLGRDLLAGVVHGARTSLVVALTVAALSTGIGIAFGALSGYFGGLLDDALMRLTEFFQTLPRFFLALFAIALFRPGLLTITAVLALTSWTMTARLLRAQVLSVREREYVIASRALGAGPLYVLREHVLPNTFAPVIVHTTLMIGQVMLIEASLAFLGLGDPKNISWGYLLNNAQSFLRTAWWMPFFPGLALTLAVLGFNFVGDAIHNRFFHPDRSK